MYIPRIVFKNFMGYANAAFDLVRGSVGIFGPNGAGKSTFLNGIYALVTNDFARFDGVKVDCIRNTANKDEESYIAGEIQHDGHVLQITRRLRGKPVSELVVDGSKPIVDSAKVEEEIQRIMGVERKLLDLYVFKTQDRIYDFLTTTPGERAKAFAVLCRTEHCEEIWDFLGNILNKDKEINEVIDDNSDEINQEIHDLGLKATDLDSKRQDEEKLLLNAKSEQTARDILRKQDRMEDILDEKHKLQEQRETLEQRKADADAAVVQAAAKVRVLQKKVDAEKESVEDAKAALKAWDAYKKYRSQRKKLQREMEELEQEEQDNKAPTPPKKTVDLKATQTQLVNARCDLADAESAVSTFTKSGLAECPTCHTPVANLADYVAECKQKVKDLPGTIAGLESLVKTQEAYDVAVRRYEKWRAGFDARVQANQKAREAIKDIKAPDGDEEQLQLAVQDFVDKTNRLDTAKTTHNKTVRAAEQVEADLNANAKGLTSCEERIVENTVLEAAVEMARRRLDEHTAAKENVARIQGELQGITGQVESLESQLRKLRAKLKRSKKVKALARIIDQARDALHRDCLPRRVAATNLASMEGDINLGLEHFSSPFWVEADESLSFIAHKPGEPPQRASALSTGQRVILALSFWPAVASLWAQDLGMLALDEPTANLDEDNRKFLSQALQAMTAKVHGQRQVIIVSHDPNLRTSFEQVVDIGVQK